MDPKALGLGLALVAYNNGMNLWHRFHGGLYVPLNLAASAAVLLTGVVVWNLDDAMLGFGTGQGAGLAVGLALGAAGASPLFAALRYRRTARAIADDRVAGTTRGDIAFRALVRVPLGTALLEEVAFRGVLFAVMAPGGALQAAVWSSAAFGLWHVAPAYNQLRVNRVVGTRPLSTVVALVALSVLTTFAAGLGLVWLRTLTGGLAAPFALHATLNSLSTVAAHLAHKRAATEVSRTLSS
ncbi:MAG TPA: CPBP family intramembrane glutamic endopeptidase [Actinomycetota bacterium]|nr:CPBP family intramembrane glutamic endopeptidase [Actinomycetota bacterium]